MSNQENNKLIAEFMDLETPDGCYFEYITKEGERSNPTHFILLEYHLSWDWLMPVVEKIESSGYEFFIVEDRIKIAHNTDHSTEIIINFTLGRNYGSKREAVYQGVLEFINEYNKNK